MIRAARLRLTAWYAAIILAILLLLGGATYVTMRRTLLAAIDRDLRLVAESATAGSLDLDRRARSEPEERAQREHPEVFLAIVSVNGRLVSGVAGSAAEELIEHRVADDALAGRSGLRTVDLEDERFRVYSAPLRRDGRVTGAVISGRSLRSHDRDLGLLLAVLGGSGAGAVVLAVVGGYLFAGRALQPIEEAYNRQRRFVGDASHELRSPLAVIRAAADLLLREPLPPAARESAVEVRETAVEAAALVDDLLALARLDHEGHAGRAASASVGERCDLAAVAADVAAQMRPLLEAHGSVPRLHLAPAGAHCRESDARRMLRALLENVIAHTPAGTAVEVHTGVEGGEAVLAVRDDGPGVPDADLPRLFDAFTRVDAARTPGTGSGLGLAIVARIARLSGGTSVARRRAPRGLEVAIHLPAG